MNDAAAVQATFADYKRVRGRKVGQLILEVPLEKLHEAISALGGEPSIHQETWCVIARLMTEAELIKGLEDKGYAPKEQPSPSSTTTAGAKRSWHELPPSQQCAIRCGEEAFWRFFEEEYGYNDKDDLIKNADDAADRVRAELHIKSRSELDCDERAAAWWRAMDRAYGAWLQSAAVVG